MYNIKKVNTARKCKEKNLSQKIIYSHISITIQLSSEKKVCTFSTEWKNTIKSIHKLNKIAQNTSKEAGAKCHQTVQ